MTDVPTLFEIPGQLAAREGFVTPGALLTVTAAAGMTGLLAFGYENVIGATGATALVAASIIGLVGGAAALKCRLKGTAAAVLAASNAVMAGLGALAFGVADPVTIATLLAGMASGAAVATLAQRNARPASAAIEAVPPKASEKPLSVSQAGNLQAAAALTGLAFITCDGEGRIRSVHGRAPGGLHCGSMIADRINVQDRPALLLLLAAGRPDASATVRFVADGQSSGESAASAFDCRAVRNGESVLLCLTPARSIAASEKPAAMPIPSQPEALRSIFGDDDFAHEVRSTLGAVASLADAMCAGDAATGAAHADYPQIMRRALHDLIDLADHALSGAGTGPVTTIGEAVANCVDLNSQGAAARSITVYNRVTRACATHPADASTLRHILGNLLGNAIKHCPEGTSVEISTSLSEDSLTVTIADNGPGMDAETLQQVGRKGFRGADAGSRPGHGYGLDLARRLAEAAGGSIRMESKTGIGTRMSLILPSDAQRKDAAVHRPGVATLPNGRRAAEPSLALNAPQHATPLTGAKHAAA
jgi:signal transduction histidine kinase